MKSAAYYDQKIEELRDEYRANPRHKHIFVMRKRLLEIAKEKHLRRMGGGV